MRSVATSRIRRDKERSWSYQSCLKFRDTAWPAGQAHFSSEQITRILGKYDKEGRSFVKGNNILFDIEGFDDNEEYDRQYY